MNNKYITIVYENSTLDDCEMVLPTSINWLITFDLSKLQISLTNTDKLSSDNKTVITYRNQEKFETAVKQLKEMIGASV